MVLAATAAAVAVRSWSKAPSLGVSQWTVAAGSRIVERYFVREP